MIPSLVASFFTLSGAGFAEPARNGFAQRCAAAAAAGFAGIGMHAADLPRALGAGLTVPEMRDILAASGLQVVELEFLAGWTGGRVRHGAVDEILTLAAAFGGRHVSAGEFAAPSDSPLDVAAAAAGLRAVADRVAGAGLTVAVEAFPWSSLSSPALAAEVTQASGATNAGLMIDVWHFFNCGATPALLAELPRGSIAAVQLNDGPLVHEDFLRHARADRRLPGHGDLDVINLVQAIVEAGFDGPFCVEANTPELRSLPVGEVARRAADAARDVLAKAGVG